MRRHVRRARVDLEVALYQLQIADALIPFQVESEDSEEIYFRNAGQARNRGLELSLSAGTASRTTDYSRIHFWRLCFRGLRG